jgi:hypothetical protein
MTVMEKLRQGTSSTDGGPRLRGHRRALLAGAGAAAASASALVLPALVIWVAAPQSTVSWTTALGFGASLWLLGTGAHLVVGAAHITVVPLLFVALALVGGTWAAVRAVRGPAQARTIVHARGLVHGPLASALGAWSVGYAACAALWAVVAFAAGPAPVLPTLVFPVLVVPAACGGLALAWVLRRRPELAGPALRRPAWLPDAVRRGVRPGLEGAATLLGTGMVICIVMVVSQLSRVSHLQTELSPDLVGGVLLALGQVLVLPNLALWAVSFSAAPTFAVLGFGVVAIVGEALPTVTASLAQVLEAVLLLPSPL